MKIKYSKNSLLIILLFFLFNNVFCQNEGFTISGGTTTITVLTYDTIWIAADSKRTSIHEFGNTPTHDIFCKIGNTKNIYYTFTGDIPFINNAAGIEVFNAYKLMNKGIVESKKLSSSYNKFNEFIITDLNAVFNKMPRNFYIQYKQE